MTEFKPGLAGVTRDKTPAELLRAWAYAYRSGPPELRFPSDPDAEFFPVDMETAAAAIEALTGEVDTAKGLLSDQIAYTAQVAADARAKALAECESEIQKSTEILSALEAERDGAAARMRQAEEYALGVIAERDAARTELSRLGEKLAKAREAQPIETAPTMPHDDPPLVMLWVTGGGDSGNGCWAFGRCYRSHDGTVRGVPSGFHGFTCSHWRPVPDAPALSPHDRQEGK